MSRPAPEGECTCVYGAGEPCAYCHAMTLWAHEELYPDDECDCGRPAERDGMCAVCLNWYDQAHDDENEDY